MQTINLNMTSGGVPPVVHLSQFDYKKQYALILYNGDEEYTIPTGATVAVCGTKRDKHPFYYDSTNEPDVVSFSGSTVTVTTPIQMTACNGNTPTEIKIEADGATLYSANYVMDIEKSALPSDEELSDIDVALIIKAIEGGEAVAGIDDKIAQATEILSHMNDNVEQSDADVVKADTSAQAAATSEANAKTSEDNAKASETASAKSESNAKTSETNAKASADSASASASAAKASETASATSATNAATSEANAKSSEEATAASQSAAKTSQTQAAGSATKAANSATKAETSATNAATSEANALESEANAKASETSAAQSASEAKASVENNEKWAKYSESYAKGGTETRTGEDVDNSKYYSDLSKEYAAQAKAAVTGVSFTIVDQLPAKGLDGVFYLIAHEHGSGDSYDEYVWISDASKFEKIGSTDVDLTDYVKVTDTATTATNGVMSASDKAKLDGIATGATKITVDDDLSETSANPVANKAVKAVLDLKATNADVTALTTKVNANAQAISDLADTSAETYATKTEVTALTDTVNGKADKATTLAGYGITDGAKASDLSALGQTVTNGFTAMQTKIDAKADATDVDALDTTVTTLQTEVNARPSTRKLATQTLTASGGTLTWTDDCITDDSLIDVYASIPNIAPSAIEQSGTTVTVTFDAQDSEFKVAIVVM